MSEISSCSALYVFQYDINVLLVKSHTTKVVRFPQVHISALCLFWETRNCLTADTA